ncbi:MAG: hypothetical protein SFZ23_07415 [Planctomycetota bacterium]|nr:hypothetical protein [Planctomycetota bacterium]
MTTGAFLPRLSTDGQLLFVQDDASLLWKANCYHDAARQIRDEAGCLLGQRDPKLIRLRNLAFALETWASAAVEYANEIMLRDTESKFRCIVQATTHLLDAEGMTRALEDEIANDVRNMTDLVWQRFVARCTELELQMQARGLQPGAFTRHAHLRTMETHIDAKVAMDALSWAIAHDTATTPPKLALPIRTEVVLWEGADHNERNVRLARTRSAYLEAHGNVVAALAALKAGGNAVGRSTFYDHLTALDSECPGWRSHLMVSGASGNPESGVVVRPRGKSRANAR